MAAKKKSRKNNRVEEPKVAYLTKQALVRAVKKGTKTKAKEAIKLRGFQVVVRKGWVVKIDEKGKVLEKVQKLPPVKSTKKIALD
jgi:hypothetical protein